MENILGKGKGNISKIFILTLIFMGVISAFSMVNAAEEQITLIVGKSVEKEILSTSWGGYTDIKYESGDETIVKLTETGNKLKGFYEGKEKIKFEALKEGTCKIKVKYYPSFWEKETEKTFIVNVQPVKPAKIKVQENPLKNVYSPGEKIVLNGMRIEVTMNDETINNLPADNFDELVLEPSVAPSTSGDYEIQVTYKGIKTEKDAGIKIHVNPPKPIDDEEEEKVPEKPVTPEKPSTPSTPTKATTPQYSDGTSVKKGDSIKMTKGNSWNVYSDSSCKTIKTYIQVNKGLTFKVEDINGNFVKLSQNGKDIGYIKWYNTSTGAMSYFTKTGSSPVNTTPDTSKNDVNCSEEMTEALNLMTELITTILTSILESISVACK